MKKLIVLLAGLFFVCTQGMAQSEASLKEDYQRYFESKLKMDFRNYMLDALALTAEEIEAIDPLIRSYMNERIQLAEQRLELIEDYDEEMQEDDNKAEKVEETSDFIENYWEVVIEEMQLKKRYFDLFEGRIPYQKALEFFMLEDELQYRISRPALFRVAPILMKLEQIAQPGDSETSAADEAPEIDPIAPADDVESIENKNTWTEIEEETVLENPTIASEDTASKDQEDWDKKSATVPAQEGKATARFYQWVDTTQSRVGLDHRYTHDALYQLTAALREMKANAYWKEMEVEERLTRIEGIADKLQENWRSTMHADWAREAFISIAELLETATVENSSQPIKETIANTAAAARKINPDRLMTKQADHIYDFIGSAKAAIQALTKSNLVTAGKGSATGDQDQ